jgi:hypothetical protein
MSYTIVLRFEVVEATSPLDATKQVHEWIKDGADKMIYEVENEETHEKWTVDLSEEDENAVLPNNE